MQLHVLGGYLLQIAPFPTHINVFLCDLLFKLNIEETPRVQEIGNTYAVNNYYKRSLNRHAYRN